MFLYTYCTFISILYISVFVLEPSLFEMVIKCSQTSTPTIYPHSNIYISFTCFGDYHQPIVDIVGEMKDFIAEVDEHSKFF